MVRAAFSRLVLVALIVFAAELAPRPGQAQSSDVIREIVVEGTQRIDPATVRSYLLVREGDRYNADRIDRSLKSLFATGLFADVSVVRSGDVITVRVVENPIINRIAFEGNTRIDDKDLEAEVSLRPRVIYTRTKVQSDVRRLLTLYRRSGRFAATVEPKVIKLPQNRVDLVFEINEGEETEIERIRFVGNKAFSDSELRTKIRTRESAWWRFFSSDDVYDPDRLTLDQELLRRFYLTEGFADFRVVSAVAELSPDRKDFYLTFTVDEGDRYTFGDTEVLVTLRGLDAATIEDAVTFEPGDWYDQDQVEETINTLTEDVGTLGYAFVDIRPRLRRDRATKTIDVTFEVSEGPRVFVERIDISGNVRTLDKVIRREFRLVEGDPYNASRLRRSRQRIRNLDFFSKVDISQAPGSAPDKAVVKVDVEEKSTGSLSFGAGFSTTSGALGDISFRERNLLGRGQDLRLRLVVAQRDSQISLSFTEPYFLNREIVAGFDVFRLAVDRQDESSFDETSLGFALRFGYPITENLAQSWRYAFDNTTIENVPDTASLSIQEQEGESTTSSISQTLAYDKLDSRIDPSEGYFARWTVDFAGIGGDVQFLRNRLEAGYYVPLTTDWVLSFRSGVGYIDGLGDDIRIFDRFFVGGDNLRGFETAGVGPRDLVTGDALGGQWFYTGSIQVAFPLGLPEEFELKGRVFTDFGSAGGLDIVTEPGQVIADEGSIRASVGAGVTWTSPFGPIGVDFGFPFLKEDFDKTETIRVNFGARF